MAEERRTADVDAWFDRADHSQLDALARIRELTLGVSSDVGECVKWSVPTFTYRGNIFSFNRSKTAVSLLWHQGALIPGAPAGLEGDTDTARTMRFTDLADVEARADELTGAVMAWMAWKDG